MKQVFEGKVYEILPSSNGIIFSYCKEKLEDKIVVAYKMVSFEDGRFTDIPKNVYLMTKFGTNYKTIIDHCDNYITTKSHILTNGKVLLLLKNGNAKLIDTDSTVVWQGNLNYRDTTASDIVIHKNSIWASFADCNILLRYNLSSMHEELRIGGSKSPFDKPKSMFLDGDHAIVCNKGSKSLTRVNLESYVVVEEENFEEEVSQYLKTDIYRFVILSSGLYLL
ncbi:MAG: hypothetical protein E7542_02845 [Ruminococcaceae bacterium]|nr:hypothetical protein [Oscillospiraceae bacterium]